MICHVQAEPQVADLIFKMKYDDDEEAFILPAQHQSICNTRLVERMDATAIAKSHGQQKYTAQIHDLLQSSLPIPSSNSFRESAMRSINKFQI